MKVYFEKFKVRAAEAASNGLAKPSAVINYFQEAAWVHADLLGVSVPALMEKGHTWVLHRLVVRFKSPIPSRSTIEIETWPSGMEKYFTFRDFRFRNDKSEVVAEGCTAWVVIDISKRKLIPVPEYIVSGRHVVENGHLPHPVGNPAGKLPEHGEMHAGPRFKVFYDHLDQNHHVNNVHYLEWMLASLPQDYLMHMHLKEADIQFKSECMLNDEVGTEYQLLADNEVLHRLYETNSKREVARAVTVWQEGL